VTNISFFTEGKWLNYMVYGAKVQKKREIAIKDDIFLLIVVFFAIKSTN
jgi:hypothetical protein